MRMASMPIAVIMQRRTLNNRWVDEAWSAVGVVPDGGGLARLDILSDAPERSTYLVGGLKIDLYPDENEGYFENCIAPEPKVFIKWRMEEGRAMPVQASVSYADGARMFDSGESADGVVMPAEIQAWLSDYLRQHYEPPKKRGKDYAHHKQGDHAH